MNSLPSPVIRAKYRELVKGLAAPAEDQDDALLSQVSLKKSKVEGLLKKHYDALPVVAPGLAHLNLRGVDPLEDAVVLPSSYTADERQAFQLQALASVEITLRVASCHETLEKLRGGLGVRSFLTRHGCKTNGMEEGTRARAVMSRAERVVKQWAFLYRHSWKCLARLGATAAELGTLRVLEQSDLIMLSSWLEDEAYKDKNSVLPWIWTTALRPLDNETPKELHDKIAAWNEEGGTCPVAQGSRTQLTFLSAVIRLEWVHATAARDRWLEELHLLKEESRRIYVSFGRMADGYEARVPDLPLPGHEDPQNEGYQWVARGYASLSQQLAAGYRRLQAYAKVDYDTCS